MDYFITMGRTIDQRWRAAAYSETRFPEIARSVLDEMAPLMHVQPKALIADLIKASTWPAQRMAPFGQPPVQVFRDARFYIEVLFWLDGTTSIHQHVFSGAFYVLGGSSMHCEYRFDVAQRINAHFMLGEIHQTGAELLKVGDCREIVSGCSFIHSLFHLERPSITVVVRTYCDPHAGPQYDYLPPYVARHPIEGRDGSQSDNLLKRQLQALEFVRRSAPDEYEPLVSAFLSNATPQIAFELLDDIVLKVDSDCFARITGNDLRARLGTDLVEAFIPVFEERIRQHRVIQRRRSIRGKDQRFFLALLLNGRERSTIFGLVEKQFPGRDPKEKIYEWVSELAQEPDVDGPEWNALGLKLPGNAIDVFKHMLNGASGEELRHCLAAEFRAEDIESNLVGIARVCSALQASCLRPLLVSRTALPFG